PKQFCPKCPHQQALKFRGVGTEQIERSLKAVLPEVRTLRIDGDTTKHKGSHDKLFRQFATQKADVLIGTQMVAKGLHFPGVTLAAILNCDSSLNIPDFRSSEQVFQLITQVAGRAGRGEMMGEVVLQTQIPENTTIQLGAKQDFEAFFQQEIVVRETFGYPPFTHFIKIQFSGENAALVEECGKKFCAMTKSMLKNVVVHPLVPSGHHKINLLFRFQFLLTTAAIYPVHRVLREIQRRIAIPRQVRLRIDVDPISTFF
ncbi:MAG: primosomal protein N', partial [Chlamydiales bacterium]